MISSPSIPERLSDATQRVPITAIILTYNEEPNLEPCLASLAGWVGEIFVVDSGSTDATLAIAERYGARTVFHPFETHSRQWKWALSQLPCSFEWVLGLDADQRITPELRDELRARFRGDGVQLAGIHGLFIKRRQIFRGSWIRHGGYYPKYLLKLFRRDQVQIDEADLLDHHFYVAGPTAKLRYDLLEENRKEDDIAFWIDKHNRYAKLVAQEELIRRNGEADWVLEGRLWGSPDQRVVWLKQRWYRMPLYVRPVFYFLYRYVLKGGFLDGKQGFIFHFLQAFWYRLLVDIQLDTLLREAASQPTAPGPRRPEVEIPKGGETRV